MSSQAAKNSQSGNRLDYDVITVATDLKVGHGYKPRSSGGNHTLPMVSTISDGDWIEFCVDSDEITDTVSVNGTDSEVMLLGTETDTDAILDFVGVFRLVWNETQNQWELK